MERVKFIGKFLALALLLIGISMASQAADKIVLKLGYSSPTTNPWHYCAEQLAQYVKDETDGQVRIDLFPAEMIGSDKQMAEMIKLGTLDMQICPQGVVAIYEPKLAALELPFLFDSNEAVAKILDGPMGEELAEGLPAKGIRVLAYWENGLRHITNNKRPILKPEDLQGLKIRTPENKMTLSIFKALGANAAPFTYSELYMALGQGIFDGQENPVTNIYASKFYEVQKYISLTNHKYESKPFIVSEKTWQKLPDNVKRALKEGAQNYAVMNRKMFAESEVQLLADLEAKGMKIDRPDLEPFRMATKPVYTEWEGILGQEFVNKVVEASK